MKIPATRTLTLVVGLTAVVVAGAGIATAATVSSASTGVISACVNDTTRSVRMADHRNRCNGGESLVQWNAKGQVGATGAAGPQGPAGAAGVAGAAGTAGAAGQSAYELAKAAGLPHTGTQAEWLASLQGAPGLDGGDGSPGTTITGTCDPGEYVSNITDGAVQCTSLPVSMGFPPCFPFGCGPVPFLENIDVIEIPAPIEIPEPLETGEPLESTDDLEVVDGEVALPSAP